MLADRSTRTSRLVAALAVVVVGALPAGFAVESSHAAASPYQRALALERRGKVRAALALLEGRRLPKAEAAHRTRLESLVEALAASAVFARVGEYALARAVLDQAER